MLLDATFTMDIIGTIGDSRLYNLHSHTEYCDGRAQMRAFAAEAVKSGFSHYGFSPHSPVPIDSPCNMAKSKVGNYLAEVDRLRQVYAGSATKFYASMEIDYLNEGWGPANDYFQQLPLDYRIGSVHFVPTRDGIPVDIDGRPERFCNNMHRYFGDDIRYVVETYFEHSVAMVKAGGFDIIGHFDKIGHNASFYAPGIETEQWYETLCDNLVDAIADAGLIVELNTKAYREHRRFFPCERNLRKVLTRGIPIVVNSDAHVPALIDVSRKEAFELLDALSDSMNCERIDSNAMIGS